MKNNPKLINILYIGDDSGAAHLLRQRLGPAGYQVEVTGNGQAGLARYAAVSPALVVVEHQLPHQNGVEILRRLAEHGAPPPIVMLHDRVDEESLMAAARLGVDEQLIKDGQHNYLDRRAVVIEKVLLVQRLTAEQQQAEVASRTVLSDEAGQWVLTETMRWAGAVVLSDTLNYDAVLDHILDQVERVTTHDAASILLIEGHRARVARWRGYKQFGSEETIASTTFNIEEIASLSAVHETGRPLVVTEVPGFDSWVSRSGQPWIRSYVTIPIGTSASANHYYKSQKYKLIGFLNVDSATPGSFSQPDAERLQMFASQAAVALHNARLYDQARQEVVNRVRALKKERNFISAILETAGALILILNAQGRILRFNRICEQVTGYSFSEVRGKRIWDLFPPAEEVEWIKARFEALSRGKVLDEYESHWVTRHGARRIIAWANTVLPDSSGQVEYIILTGTDITERKQMEEALRESEERYALAALSANDGLWDWNLKTNEIYYSPRWKAMLGYQEDQLGISPLEWFSRVHPDDLESLKASIVAHLEGQPLPFTNEHRILHRNGTYRWVLSQGLAVRNEKWQPYRLAGSQTDITQRKTVEAKLVHNALHDALTDLPNRTLFRQHLEQAIARSRQDPDYLFAVLFLDLDRFKVINDSLGHMVGDQLLMAIARRLRNNVRSRDLVARLGGDEFAIFLDKLPNIEEATYIALRIQNELSHPIHLGEHQVFTSASIGIALSTIGYDSPEDILRDADTTMYEAKAAGRARHQVFDLGMRTHAVEVWQLEAELRQAIEREEFRLYYQPIVSLADGQMVGVEALLRWHHPQRGLVMPDEFIPLAEEIGLIGTIGGWVLQTACAQVKAWQVAGYPALRLSLNVSPYQLEQHSQAEAGQTLPELVARTLKETSLPAQALELEITESTTLFDTEFSLETLQKLRQLEVCIAIDDFGMGSSFDLLRHFPLNTLKIDQSFVRNMNGNPNDVAFVKAIIAMAHSLKL
ncbi:MAG: EAL domain-containing protein, partial [Chloroflexota bacterium]